MSKLPAISIIGPGKVGTAMGALAARSGWPVAAVGGRDASKASAAAAVIAGNVRHCTPAEAARAGQLVMITVSDRAIESVCRELAAAGAFAPGSIVAHCSGALGAEVLSPARELCDCCAGSLHPLQTFATVQSAIDAMPGAWGFCEGDTRAVEVLMQLAGAIGIKPAKLDAGAKALYHAAACIASNYIPALAAAAVEAMSAAGIDKAIAADALAPLIAATAANVSQMGAAEALTGPIARGDSAVVAGHLQALRKLDDAQLERLYKAAGTWALRLAREKASIDGAAADELSRLLTSERDT